MYVIDGFTHEADAWRLGPLEPDDIQWIRRLAAAMPPEAHAVPLPGVTPLRLPEPYAWLGELNPLRPDQRHR